MTPSTQTHMQAFLDLKIGWVLHKKTSKLKKTSVTIFLIHITLIRLCSTASSNYHIYHKMISYLMCLILFIKTQNKTPIHIAPGQQSHTGQPRQGTTHSHTIKLTQGNQSLCGSSGLEQRPRCPRRDGMPGQTYWSRCTTFLFLFHQPLSHSSQSSEPSSCTANATGTLYLDTDCSPPHQLLWKHLLSNICKGVNLSPVRRHH